MKISDGQRDLFKIGSSTVGYRKPPVDTRFKPGQSGNPKGRPKGTRNPGAIAYGILNEKISVRVGDKTRIMTKFEAMFHALTGRALKGDSKATKTMIDFTMEHDTKINPLDNTLTVKFVSNKPAA